MYNYEEQTNKQNKETLDRELQLKADFKEVFSNVSGKRVYKHLLERCHIFRTTFTGNSRSYFLEGERNIGLYLLAMMNWANEEGLEIIKEIDDGY